MEPPDADLAPSTDLHVRRRRVYWSCVRWGVATGAVAGASTGALLGFESGIGERVVEMFVACRWSERATAPRSVLSFRSFPP